MKWSVNKSINVVSGESFDRALLDKVSFENALILISPSMVKLGLKEMLIHRFTDKQMHWYEERINNPDIKQIENIANVNSSLNLDIIIAIGGGSIVDTAKVLSVMLCKDNDDELLQKMKDDAPLRLENSIPVCAIPTSSGSGAESTQFATVWDMEEKKKYSLESDRILPEYVILDPELTLSLPKDQTLFTGMDALSHATECLWNKKQNALAIAYAKEAVSLIEESIDLALQNPDDFEARAKLQNAAFLAGQAISITKTAVAHAISYPLTYRYSVPHGLACSFTIPAIFELLQKRKNSLSRSNMTYIQKSANIIKKMELNEFLSKYLCNDELLAMINEMNNPQRFRNFILELESDDLEQILSKSI